MSYIWYDNNMQEVEVSEEHLKDAVKIKKEFQKASPSMRCNWTKHKLAMQIQGWDNSGTNESYRQLVKRYQGSVGELPTLQQYHKQQDEAMLKSIKELVGELQFNKRDAQLELNEMNRAKRALTSSIGFYEHFKDAFYEEFGNRKFNPDIDVVEYSSKNTLTTVVLSDIHYGKIIQPSLDNGYNIYNPDIAKERLIEYAKRIIKEYEINPTERVDIVNLGDSIEGEMMRATQPFEVATSVGEQISAVTTLIISFITTLRDYLPDDVLLTYTGIRGNHDRFVGDKKLSLPFSDASNIINYSIELIQSNIGKNFKFINPDTQDLFTTELDLGDLLVFVHGDKYNVQSRNGETIKNIEAQLSNNAFPIRVSGLIGGHYHSFFEQEVGFNREVVTTGSVCGADDYASGLLKGSLPSQLIIQSSPDRIEYKKIVLH